MRICVSLVAFLVSLVPQDVWANSSSDNETEIDICSLPAFNSCFQVFALSLEEGVASCQKNKFSYGITAQTISVIGWRPGRFELRTEDFEPGYWLDMALALRRVSGTIATELKEWAEKVHECVVSIPEARIVWESGHFAGETTGTGSSDKIDFSLGSRGPPLPRELEAQLLPSERALFAAESNSDRKLAMLRTFELDHAVRDAMNQAAASVFRDVFAFDPLPSPDWKEPRQPKTQKTDVENPLLRSAEITLTFEASLTVRVFIKGPPSPPLPACQDKKDNDADSLTDYPADPGCESADDKDEWNPQQLCDDEKECCCPWYRKYVCPPCWKCRFRMSPSGGFGIMPPTGNIVTNRAPLVLDGEAPLAWFCRCFPDFGLRLAGTVIFSPSSELFGFGAGLRFRPLAFGQGRRRLLGFEVRYMVIGFEPPEESSQTIETFVVGPNLAIEPFFEGYNLDLMIGGFSEGVLLQAVLYLGNKEVKLPQGGSYAKP